jgi:parallel beta-helix repeat protein
MKNQIQTLQIGSARPARMAPQPNKIHRCLVSQGARIMKLNGIRSIAAGFLVLLAAGCGPKGGGGFVVNSSSDAGDSHPGDRICRTTASATECTLRAAIQEADALAGSDTITFNLPGPSFTISTASVLPDITDTLVIDGTTQPGYIKGSNMPTIDGIGMAAPVSIDGLTVAAGIDVTLKGFAVIDFPADGIVNRGRLTLNDVYVGRNRDVGLASGGGSEMLPVSIVDSVFIDNGSAGISADHTDITMTNGDVSGNHGGMGVSNGSLTMTGTQISGNSGTTLSPFGGIGLFHSRASLTAVLVYQNDSHDYGGGIDFVSDGSQVLTVADSTISDNTAYHGGGIEVEGGTVHLNHTTLIDNKARTDGGAVRVLPGTSGAATLWLENGTTIGQPGHGNISEFDTHDAAFGRGGGIYSEATVRMDNSTIEGNSGDGLFNGGAGSLFIQNSAIRGNSMDGITSNSFPAAGAIQISASTIQANLLAGINAYNANLFIIGTLIADNMGGGLRQNGGTLNFSYSTVSGNDVSEGFGGGIGAIALTSADISQSTISGNRASGNGGGLYLQAHSGAVRNVTISGNYGSLGGGMLAAGDSTTLNNVTIAQNTGVSSGGLFGDERLTIRNSILAGNTPYNCAGPEPFVSGGDNLDDGSTCGLAGPGDLSGASAVLGPLADNGGGSLTHALLAGSPAIDAGNDATCLPLDQRNVVRPQGAHCDIGAFELIPASATPTPTRTPFPSGTVTASPTPTLGLTPSGTSASILFDPVTFSSDKLYQGGQSCDPKTLIVRARVTPAEPVSSIGLFYRIEAKQGNHSYPWSEGLAMIPQGGGWYQLVLSGNDLPSIGNWQSEAWLDFQFVANGPNNQPIAWSAVFRNVTLWQCYV